MRELFDFSTALVALREGHKARRACWRKGIEVYLRKPKGKMGAFFVAKVDEDKYETYNPDTCDILAEDWDIILVKESPKECPRCEGDKDGEPCKKDDIGVKVFEKKFDTEEEMFEFLDYFFKNISK